MRRSAETAETVRRFPARPGIETAVDANGRRPSPEAFAWAFVFLGIASCTLRYGLRFPIWPDEAFLAVNFTDGGSAAIFSPLAYHQVAPPLFLVAEMLAVRLLGFNEWALRLVPFLAAIASLFLFRAIARRLLSGWAFAIAVGFFAASYWVTRYSAEMKPYTIDICVSLLLLWLAIRWWIEPRRAAPLLGLMAVATVAFALSFPAVFVGGGVVLFMAAAALDRGSPARPWPALAVGACLGTGFLVIYGLHTAGQVGAESSWMQAYWDRAFPPGTSVGAFLLWCLGWASGELMPYPVGGKNAGSAATLLCVVVGLGVAARRWRRSAVVLLLAPFGLAFIAAVARQYPFGAPTRCQLYAAPALCVLAGLGLTQILTVLARGRVGAGPAQWACVVLLVIGATTMGRDLGRRAKTSTDMMIRDFARVFWGGRDLVARPSLCLRGDLATSFTPEHDARQSLLTSYLCNFHFYAEPRCFPEPAAWPDGVQVVNYRFSDEVGEHRVEPRQAAWIESFELEHRLSYTGSVYVPIPEVDNHEVVVRLDVIEIMSFEPLAAVTGGSARGAGSSGAAPAPPGG